MHKGRKILFFAGLVILLISLGACNNTTLSLDPPSVLPEKNDVDQHLNRVPG